MRKFVCILVVLCLVVVSPAAWASKPTLEKALAESPTVLELQEIMRDIAARAALADPVALEAAFRASDVAEATELLGFTAEEYLALDARLNHLRVALGNEFPELKRRAALMVPESCGFSPSFAQCHVHQSLAATGDVGASFALTDGPVEEHQDVACEWGQYLAALTLCTLAGPVWYWPCAYLALCSYCSGGWVDQSCF